MKIIRLASSNVKKLSAIEITPDADGALVTVGGKNGAGKSSVLDSIAYALGGDRLVPTEPIRAGQSSAKITVDLGDYIITRKFTRDRLPCDCGVTNPGDMPIVGDDEAHTASCASKTKFGPTRSVLAVTNKEGAKYPSPQALLDKLYGQLTFDPLAFSKEKPAQQNEILRRICNLDFTLVDTQRRTLFEVRAMEKKTAIIAEAKVAQLPKHPTSAGVYDTVETPIDAVATEIQRAGELKTAALEAGKVVEKLTTHRTDLLAFKVGATQQIDKLQQQIDHQKLLLKTCEEDLTKIGKELADAEAARIRADEAVPAVDALTEKMKALDVGNARARHNKVFLEQEQELKQRLTLIAELTKKIETIDEQKAAALQSAKFPVEGLGLTDDGVTFEGLPLEQVSSSVQLRVSIAIGLALNPTLKVLLIRNGNLLDDDSLKTVAAQAATAGAQVWMEYVTSDSGDVSVMLEDGHIA